MYPDPEDRLKYERPPFVRPSSDEHGEEAVDYRPRARFLGRANLADVEATYKITLQYGSRRFREQSRILDKAVLAHIAKLVMFVLGIAETLRTTDLQIPSAIKLENLTDWVPSKQLRKKLKKLIADDRAEINDARFHGRKWLARWRSVWLHINWWRYLMSEPLTKVAGLLKRSAS